MNKELLKQILVKQSQDITEVNSIQNPKPLTRHKPGSSQDIIKAHSLGLKAPVITNHDNLLFASNPVYGNKQNQQFEQASTYAKANNIPWRMNDFKTIPTSQYSTPNAHAISRGYIVGDEGAEQLGYAKGAPFTSDRAILGLPSLTDQANHARVNGYNWGSQKPDPELANQIRYHEGIHAVTGDRVDETAWLKDKYPKVFRNVPEDKAVYPELVPAEIAPALSAIQAAHWEEHGKRMESPEDFDSYIANTDYNTYGDDEYSKRISKLPIEAQRYHNYRRSIGLEGYTDPDTGEEIGAEERLREFDNMSRELVPSFTNNRQPTNKQYLRQQLVA